MIKSISLIMVGVAVIIIAIGYIKPGEKPSYKCAEPGEKASYFLDKSQGDCKITSESFNAVLDWNKGIYGSARGTINRTMAVVFLMGLIGLITGAVMGKRAKKAPQSE